MQARYIATALIAATMLTMSQLQAANVIPEPTAATSKKVTTQPTVKSGAYVSIDYVGTFENGVVFDTNIRSIANKNGLYTHGRKYIPLTFILGRNVVIPGLEKALIGMKKGETKTVKIAPVDAYGTNDPTKIQIISRSYFTDANIQPEVGSSYSLQGNIMKVTGISGDLVTLDSNHPLAGKTLTFTVRLKEFTQLVPLPGDAEGFPQGVMDASQYYKITKGYTEGSKNSSITMIEYSDPECPFCIRHFNDHTVASIMTAFPKAVRYMYKPVEGVNHPGTAYKSAAILCAGKVGGASGYIAMYQGILGGSTIASVMDTSGIAAIAKANNIDQTAWSTCITNNDMAKAYERNRSELLQWTDSPGTPSTIIINNKTRQRVLVAGAYPVKVFTDIISMWTK